MTTSLPRRNASTTAKVVVTGPFDAGKTTLIRTISDTTVHPAEPGAAEADGTDAARSGIAMDFGRIAIDEDLSLVLVGTPEPQNSEFLWDILAEGMLGYLLVVDASRPSCLPEARRARRHFESLADVPSVVVVNKVTHDEDRTIQEIRSALELPEGVPVFAADVRDRSDVKRVLVTFLHAVLGRLEAGNTEKRDHARTGDVG